MKLLKTKTFCNHMVIISVTCIWWKFIYRLGLFDKVIPEGNSFTMKECTNQIVCLGLVFHKQLTGPSLFSFENKRKRSIKCKHPPHLF